MSNEITIYNDELNKPAVIMQFERMLGKRGAASFISGILGAVKDNPRLLECPPENVANEALRGAAYNLPLAFGMSWLVPRNSTKHGGQMAAWQVGYKGLLQLAMRSKDHVVIRVAELYQGQSIVEDQLTGRVRIDGENKGGEPVGYFGYLKKVNGYEGFVYWPMTKILAHKKRYAKGTDRRDSTWNTNPEDMYKKTVLTDLLKKHATLEFDIDDLAGEFYEDSNDGEADEAGGDFVDGSFEDVDEEEVTDPAWNPAGLYASVSDNEGTLYSDKNKADLSKIAATLNKKIAALGEPQSEAELAVLTELTLKRDAAEFYMGAK